MHRIPGKIVVRSPQNVANSRGILPNSSKSSNLFRWMVSGWIQCLFHPSNKSTASVRWNLQVNVPQGQTVATVIANTVVLCILIRSTLGRRDVCWIYLLAPSGTKKPSWHLTYPGPSRALLKIFSLFKEICDCSLGGRGFKQFLILKMFHVILVDDSWWHKMPCGSQVSFFFTRN